jgi:flagellin-like hook-associated protein FlgL
MKMSGITLSAAVRQNLLSLQSTADLLSTTQNRLATGNKVNSALDNPTNYFTAQSLDNRASDIGNLLDSIGNGVQVLQAANTGITSLQKLVDSAKSVANQVLQAPVGYSQKSQVTSIALDSSVTATNLLGGTSSPIVSTAVQNDATGQTTAPVTPANGPVTLATVLSGSAGATSNNLKTGLTTTDTITVNGQTIHVVASGATGNDVNQSDTLGTLLGKINAITGGTSSIDANGVITLKPGSTAISLSGATGTLAKIGLSTVNGSALTGTSISIPPTDSSSTATNVTFGYAAGQIHDLNGLNAALASNHLQASLNSSNQLVITTDNDHASETMKTLTGSAVGATAGLPFTSATAAASAPVKDSDAQSTRAGLISQYNNIIQQIDTTAADSSFGGINLLNGDTLNLTFDETGKSKLAIQGVTFNSAGLGLASLTTGTDFLDNSSANTILSKLTSVSSSLRTEASTLGSNLSIVQIRQDFNTNMINVLQTGSSNLTLADTNEEAANSQALSTRQSIAVSALSLANQSQQSVLQLLR